MKCAILQPHYFPWLGYFSMVNSVDIFVIFDDVKYIKREWKNRNKIRKSPFSEDFKWISVPIKKNSQESLISQTEIDYSHNWISKHLNSIRETYSKTKFYTFYIQDLEKIITKKHKYLADLNIDIINFFCNIYKIKTNIIRSSNLKSSGKKDQKLLSICKELKANEYLANNLSKSYIDIDMFKASNIEIKFQDFSHPKYDQIFDDKKLKWISNLSILDYLFNYGDLFFEKS
tara:strand:+ start:818 stop:1510 length:693 start_codon:yes stop_codon:yes gene_type:complete